MIDPPTIPVYDLGWDISDRIQNPRTEGNDSHVTPPELLKTVACVCNHAMHGRLVHGTHVYITLLALNVRLHVPVLIHNLLIFSIN